MLQQELRLEIMIYMNYTNVSVDHFFLKANKSNLKSQSTALKTGLYTNNFNYFIKPEYKRYKRY